MSKLTDYKRTWESQTKNLVEHQIVADDEEVQKFSEFSAHFGRALEALEQGMAKDQLIALLTDLNKIAMQVKRFRPDFIRGTEIVMVLHDRIMRQEDLQIQRCLVVCLYYILARSPDAVLMYISCDPSGVIHELAKHVEDPSVRRMSWLILGWLFTTKDGIEYCCQSGCVSLFFELINEHTAKLAEEHEKYVEDHTNDLMDALIMLVSRDSERAVELVEPIIGMVRSTIELPNLWPKSLKLIVRLLRMNQFEAVVTSGLYATTMRLLENPNAPFGLIIEVASFMIYSVGCNENDAQKAEIVQMTPLEPFYRLFLSTSDHVQMKALISLFENIIRFGNEFVQPFVSPEAIEVLYQQMQSDNQEVQVSSLRFAWTLLKFSTAEQMLCIFGYKEDMTDILMDAFDGDLDLIKNAVIPAIMQISDKAADSGDSTLSDILQGEIEPRVTQLAYSDDPVIGSIGLSCLKWYFPGSYDQTRRDLGQE